MGMIFTSCNNSSYVSYYLVNDTSDTTQYQYTAGKSWVGITISPNSKNNIVSFKNKEDISKLVFGYSSNPVHDTDHLIIGNDTCVIELTDQNSFLYTANYVLTSYNASEYDKCESKGQIYLFTIDDTYLATLKKEK